MGYYGSLSIDFFDCNLERIVCHSIYKVFLQLSGPISEHMGPKHQLMMQLARYPETF